MVLVDLWDQWPGRRLPPMPNLVSTRPESSTVSASLGGLPGVVEELPIPDQQTISPAGSGSSGAPSTRTSSPSRRIAIARSGDAPAESDTEVYPLLGIRAFDVWSTWPGVEALPMPAQAPVAAATSQDHAAAVVQEGGTPTSDGASPIQADAALLLAILFGPLVGLRERALAMRGLARPVRSTWLRQRPGPWFRQRTLRGLAVLRLVLGILRSL
jgi:hypothetical protein